MKRICVFCGSSPGARPKYIQAARELVRLLTKRKIGLVYGGALILAHCQTKAANNGKM